jgi:alpha-L-fucosidase
LKIWNKIKRVTVLGEGTELSQRVLGGAPWAGLPGVLCIAVPSNVLDEYATALKVELDGPLDLYSGNGDVITMNVS